MPEKPVFHGTPKQFDSDVAVPRKNIRTKEGVVIFDEESFHATPHKWIALAYMYNPEPIPQLGDSVRYGMGVDLDSDTKAVLIYGVGSLEDSLMRMYGDGGFLYHFDDENFIYKQGLGAQEVITQKPTSPTAIERIDNPVEEMKNLGVTFSFVDLSLPENAKYK